MVDDKLSIASKTTSQSGCGFQPQCPHITAAGSHSHDNIRNLFLSRSLDQDPQARNVGHGQLLDREQEISISEHSRPHWTQSGTITFITMRLADSLPRETIERWDRERLAFLLRCGIECKDWRIGREGLSDQDSYKFKKQFRRLREDELDSCHGKCHLRNPNMAKIVGDSLLFFDNDRYLMGDFVVMPNHLHFLAVFPDEDSMRKQRYSWMKYTATLINRANRVRGKLWQAEPFDHLVRSEKQLVYLRDYIEQNPMKAKL